VTGDGGTFPPPRCGSPPARSRWPGGASNLACTGNGAFDVVCWLPSLHLEGGLAPWEVLPDAGDLAAVIAGFFASRAGLPPPSGAPTVREFQRAQACLPWAARELGLPAPF